MSFRAWLLTALLAVPLLSLSIAKLNRTINYTPVMAAATSVEAECYLYAEEDGLLSKTTITSESLPCDKAEKLQASHPAYRDRTVKGEMEISFEYISPADNRQHSGTLIYSYERYKPLMALEYGANLPILAHETDPAKVMQDFDSLA
ncbi:hypothetical protein [Sphingopyxis sp. R3-92]|uniref:hypothetical protein n=1 Tax=Sphingopyxis sp. R3-92 TaxID=3158553 RepID=UPI003EE54DE0